MVKWTCLQGLIFNNIKWKSQEAGWRWKICIKSGFLHLSVQCVSPEDLNKRGTFLQKLLSWVYWLYVQHSACQLHLPVFIYLFILLSTLWESSKPSYTLAFTTLEAELLWRRRPQWCTQWESSVSPKWQLSGFKVHWWRGPALHGPAVTESRDKFQILLLICFADILTDVLCARLHKLWCASPFPSVKQGHTYFTELWGRLR